MSAPQDCQPTLVQSLAILLRNYGDSVLDGSSTMTLPVTYIQHLTHLFEQYLMSRTNQHSFLALRSHPADTAMLLELQFLFDMLQKTISLKLVHLPGVRLQSVVKIFPFKSLKHLELKRIPPHCLEGLHGIYSQLEVFICSKSLNSLKELLLLCGGDLSTALPWLELHTLNFSCNYISSLDESLRLLNVLKSLDLSHNKIQECAEFLKTLCELKHLNLAYNKLQRAPELGLNTRARLVTLVLRHNQLESINGVEHLSYLQCLDLAYNLLMQHTQLAPLAFLHNLNLLTLEGNPLYFQKTHRTSTMYYLSPQAAFRGLQLDGSTLSSTELAILSNPRQLKHQMSQTHSVRLAPEQTVHDMPVGGDELSHSLPISESGASRDYIRKSKKLKVRTASISEPSNTERSSSSLQDLILCHQKDIEKLDSFREQMGKDWLLYQNHLHGTPAIVLGPRVDEQVIDKYYCTPSPTLTKTDCTMPRLDSLFVPLLSSKLKTEKQGIIEFYPETESTLQWTDHSFLDKESTLGDPQHLKKACTEPAFGEDEELGVDLCRPMLVRVLSEIKDTNTGKELEPLFLRVQQAYILEVDMHQGCVRSRFELDSLRRVNSSHPPCTQKGKESFHPVLELHFSYVNREKQRRHYLMLDDDPQEALQVLLEQLSKIAMENELRAKKKNTEIVWLQCLKCQAEFPHALFQKSIRGLSEPDVYPEDQDRTKEKENLGDAVLCPECNSDHVIQLAGQVFPSTSTLEPCCQINDRFDYIDHQKTDDCSNNLISFQFSDSQMISDQKESKDGLANSCSGATHKSCQDTQGYGHEFETVDHRLKLFLDVEVFKAEEEIYCFLKMSVVKFGCPEEFPSLVVVSSQRIYILEMTSKAEELFSEWLQKKDSYQLCELSYLELGLGSQSIHMAFDVSAAAYTLLIRDSARCKHFFNQLTIARESAPKTDSKFKTILNPQLNPKHYLWPLVYEGSKTGNEDNYSPFFYLLAFLQLGDSLTSVTVLATQETLFLLDEDHQWSKSCSYEETQTSSRRVTVNERQPVSHVSSIHLFSSDPCQVDIQFYDELAKEEKTWPLRAESIQGIQNLVNWIKDHWEAMFGVKLITTFQL